MRNISDAANSNQDGRLSFGVMGGDKRYEYLTRLLKQDGYIVHGYGWPDSELSLEPVLNADIIILPMPLTRDGKNINLSGIFLNLDDILHNIFTRAKSPKIILAGQIPEKYLKIAEERNLILQDILKQEPMAIANAAATASAAIALTIETLERDLSGKRCLILGYGRIGKLLAYKLHGVGASVSIAARKSRDRAWVRAYGFQALNILNQDKINAKIADFDIIYNTIPAPVLDSKILTRVKSSCVWVELASRPGIEINKNNASENASPRMIQAAGLPGRIVPWTAAEILRDIIYEILREGGIL